MFDQRDMKVFSKDSSRKYFEEILQLYYNKNYRATIVFLYSFLLYDLYDKIQIMANDGNKSAKAIIDEITKMINDDSKYSSIEHKIIDYFKNNYKHYFNNFIQDIDYLENCRHKCAHIIMTDDLYIPKDYQVKMLIVSLYDNVFSRKAPFITDLFEFVKGEIEEYTNNFPFYDDDNDSGIYEKLEKKYFNAMTDESLVKTVCTFMKLLFISKDEYARKNEEGLYIFLKNLLKYLVIKGKQNLLSDTKIIGLLEKLYIENELYFYFIEELFSCSHELLKLLKIHNINYYKWLEGQIKTDFNDCIKYISIIEIPNEMNVFDFVISLFPKFKWSSCRNIREKLSSLPKYDIDVLYLQLINKIPTFDGFDKADEFMNIFIEDFLKLKNDTIENILNIYKKNSQCMKRNAHKEDIKKLAKIYKENFDLSYLFPNDK